MLLVSTALASLWCQHNLVYKVDDGSRRLFGIQLCEKVANVFRHAPGLLGNKTEYFRGRAVCVSPPSVLWVQTAVCHTVDGIMSSEEHPALAVCECDALR